MSLLVSLPGVKLGKLIISGVDDAHLIRRPNGEHIGILRHHPGRLPGHDRDLLHVGHVGDADPVHACLLRPELLLVIIGLRIAPLVILPCHFYRPFLPISYQIGRKNSALLVA